MGSFIAAYVVTRYSRLDVMKVGILVQGGSLALILIGVYTGMYFLFPIAVMAYIIAFASGLGSMVGLYTFDLVPPNGAGFSFATIWLETAIGGKLYPIGIEVFGANTMLIIFTILCFICWFIMDKYILDSLKVAAVGKQETNTKARELQEKLV